VSSVRLNSGTEPQFGGGRITFWGLATIWRACDDLAAPAWNRHWSWGSKRGGRRGRRLGNARAVSQLHDVRYSASRPPVLRTLLGIIQMFTDSQLRKKAELARTRSRKTSGFEWLCLRGPLPACFRNDLLWPRKVWIRCARASEIENLCPVICKFITKYSSNNFLKFGSWILNITDRLPSMSCLQLLIHLLCVMSFGCRNYFQPLQDNSSLSVLDNFCCISFSVFRFLK